MDDLEIIGLYWARSEKAVGETANKYGKALHTLAERIVLNFESAEECVSDAYLRAWNAIPPQKPEFLYAFLAKITRRLAFDTLDKSRAKKRSATVVELENELDALVSAPSDTEAQYDEQRLTELLSAFLSGLPYEKRNIFLRRYWFADSIAEIATRFSVSESKVKAVLFRVRNELKEYLLKEGIAV